MGFGSYVCMRFSKGMVSNIKLYISDRLVHSSWLSYLYLGIVSVFVLVAVACKISGEVKPEKKAILHKY